jgi:hypothetical protein
MTKHTFKIGDTVEIPFAVSSVIYGCQLGCVIHVEGDAASVGVMGGVVYVALDQLRAVRPDGSVGPLGESQWN